MFHELILELASSPAERWGENVGRHPLLLLLVVAALVLGALGVAVAAYRWAAARREAISFFLDGVASRLREALRHLVPAQHRAAAGRTAARLAPRAYLLLHLALGLLLTIAVLAFVILAEETVPGAALERFDLGFSRGVARHADPTVRRLMFVLTQLGSTLVVTLVAAAVAIHLHARRAGVLVLGWTAAVAGGLLLNPALKWMFERTRPTLSDPSYAAAGWSFPSGHAMSALVMAGMGAYLVLVLGRTWTLKLRGIAAALGWVWLIGFTRLYLGVHYPSDVLAGYAAAAAWLAVAISGTELARRRQSGAA